MRGSRLSVVSNSGRLSASDALRVLRERRLYKSLSLHTADAVGVPVLSSVLLLDPSDELLSTCLDAVGLPVMLRMDYSSLPSQKPLGGVPIYTPEAVSATAEHLWQLRLYPLFQTHVSRFLDLYSVGAVLTHDSSVALIEVVGPGFDASDLRLGFSDPHEWFRVDLVSSRVIEHGVASSDAYSRDRARRLLRIAKWRRYVELVNQTHQLLWSLDVIDSAVSASDKQLLPLHYVSLPRILLNSVIGYCRLLGRSAIQSLPSSPDYVASFSFTKHTGWVLWDLYGAWYRR